MERLARRPLANSSETKPCTLIIDAVLCSVAHQSKVSNLP